MDITREREGKISFIGLHDFLGIGFWGLISNANSKTDVLHYIGHHKFIDIINLKPIQSHPIACHLSQEPSDLILPHSGHHKLVGKYAICPSNAFLYSFEVIKCGGQIW